MMRRYVAWGPVRGHCGHEHRTIQRAHECALSDHRASRAGGAMSDRSVVAVSGYDRSDRVPMTDAECDTLQELARG